MQKQSCFCVKESLPALSHAWSAFFPGALDNHADKVSGPWPFGPSQSDSAVLVETCLRCWWEVCRVQLLWRWNSKASPDSEGLELHLKWRWEAFVFLGQSPSLWKLFPPWSEHFPQHPSVLHDPLLVRTPASPAVWVSLILFHCVFLEGCI